jgi:hypothetical protein
VHFAKPTTAIHTVSTASIIAERNAFGISATRAADVSSEVAKPRIRDINICCRDAVEVREQRLAIKVALVMSAHGTWAERRLRFVGEQRYLHPYPAT